MIGLTRRVTIVHPNLHFIGGAEKLMAVLATGLADAETKVDVVTGLCHEIWKSELSKKPSISIREVGEIAQGRLGFWLGVRGFARALSRLIHAETDVIVTSSFPSSLAAAMFTERHDAKVVHYLHEAPMVLHDKDGVKTLPFRLRLFYRAMSSLYARDDIEAVATSDVIIANSMLTRAANSKVYGIDESSIELVYPGVNPEHIAPPASVPSLVSNHVKEGVPIIFVPKGAQSWRNPEICLQALRGLAFRFLAVFTGGTNHERGRLLKCARRSDIPEMVLWAREFSNEDLSGLYSHSSIVISIPRRQPFGLIPLEALLHGAPPIISSSSGVAEVLRDHVDAICIDESKPDELANAIRILVSDDEMRGGIVSNGRRTILDRLTSTRFVKEMKEKISS